MNNNLNWHEKDMLIAVLMYHLEPDVRQKVMAQIPTIYNKYHGKQICAVVQAAEGVPLDVALTNGKIRVLSEGV